jgi:hypothetical protein
VISKFKSHEFDPTVQFLERYLSENELSKKIFDAKKRVHQMLELMQTLSILSDDMINLKHEILAKIMKYGAKIQMLMRDNNS